MTIQVQPDTSPTQACELMTSPLTNGDQPVQSVIFAGGGSGGHLMPGIAIAEELAQKFPGCRLAFLTGDRTMDQKLSGLVRIPPETLTIRHLSVPPLRSALTRPWHFVPRMTGSLLQAVRFMKAQRPQVVIGLGGIASVPGVLAGVLCRRPIILLEQNTTPGVATCQLSRFADVLCEGLPLSHRQGLARRLRIVSTGIPLRREFNRLDTEHIRGDDRPRGQLMIIGGSQGASRLNRLVIDALTTIVQQAPDGIASQWKILHQTGERDLDWVRESYRLLRLNATATTFVAATDEAMRASQLIISRAGAVTIAELLATQSTAVLVPLQNVAREHQTQNAQWYSQVTGSQWLNEWDEDAVKKLAAQIQLQMNSHATVATAQKFDAGVEGVITEITRLIAETSISKET